jgi:hypothetical protein
MDGTITMIIIGTSMISHQLDILNAYGARAIQLFTGGKEGIFSFRTRIPESQSITYDFDKFTVTVAEEWYKHMSKTPQESEWIPQFQVENKCGQD